MGIIAYGGGGGMASVSYQYAVGGGGGVVDSGQLINCGAFCLRVVASWG